MNSKLWRKVEELFHGALERTSGLRKTYLDESCGEDRELRQQVEILLAQEAQAGSFLEVSAIENMPVTLTGRVTLGTNGRALSHRVSVRRRRHGRSLSRAR